MITIEEITAWGVTRGRAWNPPGCAPSIAPCRLARSTWGRSTASDPPRADGPVRRPPARGNHGVRVRHGRRVAGTPRGGARPAAAGRAPARGRYRLKRLARLEPIGSQRIECAAQFKGKTQVRGHSKMTLSTSRKSEIVRRPPPHARDTGSPEVQRLRSYRPDQRIGRACHRPQAGSFLAQRTFSSS